MASTYHISKYSTSTYGSLVDRGANGGLAGADVCVMEELVEKYLSLVSMIMNYLV